jgi:hypothetical protein
MSKTSLFVIAAAALILGLGGWAASTPHARVAAFKGLQVDTIQSAVNARTLPTQHYDDYSFVF